MNAQTKITAKSKLKPKSLNDKLLAVFASIMENLGGHSNSK